MKSGFLLSTCLVLVLACVADSRLADAQSNSSVSPLSVCDNLHVDPAREVRVRAIYRVGFEWSELYSLQCPNAQRVWISFADDWQAHTKKAARKELNKGEGTYGVTFVGIVGGRGGHLRAYPLTFKVTSVEEATRLGKESVMPHALPRNVRRRVESFEASR